MRRITKDEERAIIRTRHVLLMCVFKLYARLYCDAAAGEEEDERRACIRIYYLKIRGNHETAGNTDWRHKSCSDEFLCK